MRSEYSRQKALRFKILAHGMDTSTKLLLILLFLHLVHCLAFPLDPLPWHRPAHLEQSRCTAKRPWPHTTLSSSAGGKNEGVNMQTAR